MKLRLFNTQTRACETIEITEKDKPLGVYCCGPTVYGPAHVGNFRTYVVQDTVLRLLKILGIRYCYVRNLTDVDDKTIRGSQEKNQPLAEYTRCWTEIFERDCELLNLLKPTFSPKATETIQEQQALISTLIQKGHAYERGGSVYFRITSFETYGKLSHLEERSLQTQEQNSAGRSNDADEYDREQVADFALWKAYKPEDGDVFWKSPWGNGRPGWHIECSAMAHKFLGDTVDLHTGGIDLCFPHHENEIAQSEAAYGKPFVRHWLHIAHLKVEGQKMSKRLGNLLTLDMLAEKHYGADVVRYALSAGHYRQSLNFTFDLLQSSQSALRRIYVFVRRLLEEMHIEIAEFNNRILDSKLPKQCLYLGDVFESLLDDLNLPKALGCLFSFINQKHVDLDKDSFLMELAPCLYALGICIPVADKEDVENIPEFIRELAEQRWNAKKMRDFEKADALRRELNAAGWQTLDSKEGYQLIKP
jgi:cysteinyl-tRNA synthetase